MAVGNAYESNGMVAQRIQKQIGQTGIETHNVFNACATGATAVRSAHLAIQAGEADVALVIGVEKMGKMGMLGAGNKIEYRRVKLGRVVDGLRIVREGLKPGDVAEIDRQTKRVAGLVCRHFGRPETLMEEPGAGAAGGIAFGLMAAAGAH